MTMRERTNERECGKDGRERDSRVGNVKGKTIYWLYIAWYEQNCDILLYKFTENKENKERKKEMKRERERERERERNERKYEEQIL